LLELAGATGELRYFEAARRLLELMLEFFADREGGFYFTASDHEKLIVRAQDPTDHAIPSGNSVAATVFIQMGEWTSDEIWRKRADSIFAAFVGVADKISGGIFEPHARRRFGLDGNSNSRGIWRRPRRR
jgi:uncharacterized protein YyaL (SSP411 family)